LAITTLVIGVVALAGIMRGITGFGGAMLMTPPLGILLGAAPAIVLVLVLEAAAALVMVPAICADLPLKRLALLTVPACVSVPIGSMLLTSLDPSSSRRLIGVVVIVFSFLLLSGLRYCERPAAITTAAVGALSGALLGATSIGAPPVILFLLSGPDPARNTRAILTVFISITSLMGVGASLFVGGVAAPPLLWTGLLTMLYLAATFLGMKVFHRLNDFGARLIALSLMLVFGALAILIA
jgi:uncharacterized membrane protein YfcA